jgi:uncharacterized protein
MSETTRLNNPWFVAVWPGMGHVAASAGFYLISKLEMHLLAEVQSEGVFDVDHVEVKDGIIRTANLPRSRYFVWKDPEGKRDGVVFIGEAQPPQGKYAFCRRMVAYAKEIGADHIFTFAAMATDMRPEQDSRVFCAATDVASLEPLKQLDLELVTDGHISGLNGIVLGAASDAGLKGTCLLGEMPQLFAQLPFPKASLEVLRVFTRIVNVSIDLAELEEQSDAMTSHLSKWLRKLERSIEQESSEEREDRGDEDEESEFAASLRNEVLTEEEEERIEQLFSKASKDRSKAYELKRVLDQLRVFEQYENRFLDLFKKPQPEAPSEE